MKRRNLLKSFVAAAFVTPVIASDKKTDVIQRQIRDNALLAPLPRKPLAKSIDIYKSNYGENRASDWAHK